MQRGLKRINKTNENLNRIKAISVLKFLIDSKLKTTKDVVKNDTRIIINVINNKLNQLLIFSSFTVFISLL
jgi:hypothetical protein